MFDGAKSKFDELETKQEAMIQDGAQRLAALEAKFARLEALENALAGMQMSDVAAIRQKVAEAGIRS